MSNHQLPVFNGTDQQCGNAHKAQGYDAQYPNNPNYMLGYNNPGSELDRLRAINAELLAALQGIFAQTAKHSRQWGQAAGAHAFASDPDTAKAFAQARAAIAKAGGQS